MTEEGILSGENDRSKTWLTLEKSRMARHWLPWRPNVRDGETEEDCEDPERLIMFDDLSSLMFEIASVENKLHLVLSLLSLIGHEQSKGMLENLFSKSLLSQRIQSYELESFCDIDDYALDKLQDGNYCASIEIGKTIKDKFIENVLHQAANKFTENPKTRLTVLWIDWKAARLKSMEDELKKDRKKWKSNCKELKKWIKDILKEETNRNNILLWQMYATVEELLGNKEDSANVVDTVLSMNILTGGILKIKDIITKCEICQLCRQSAEKELGIRNSRDHRKSSVNRENALHILCSLVDNEQYKPLHKNCKVPPTKVLRARKSYGLLFDHLLENDTDDIDRVVSGLPEAGSSLEHIVVCYTYFQYLTLDVRAASVIFQQVIIIRIIIVYSGATQLDHFNKLIHKT